MEPSYLEDAGSSAERLRRGLSRIADRLGVPPQVIDQTLAGAAAPMD